MPTQRTPQSVDAGDAGDAPPGASYGRETPANARCSSPTLISGQ